MKNNLSMNILQTLKNKWRKCLKTYKITCRKKYYRGIENRNREYKKTPQEEPAE